MSVRGLNRPEFRESPTVKLVQCEVEIFFQSNKPISFCAKYPGFCAFLPRYQLKGQGDANPKHEALNNWVLKP